MGRLFSDLGRPFNNARASADLKARYTSLRRFPVHLTAHSTSYSMNQVFEYDQTFDHKQHSHLDNCHIDHWFSQSLLMGVCSRVHQLNAHSSCTVHPHRSPALIALSGLTACSALQGFNLLKEAYTRAEAETIVGVLINIQSS
jgi:hypothetical protein